MFVTQCRTMRSVSKNACRIRAIADSWKKEPPVSILPGDTYAVRLTVTSSQHRICALYAMSAAKYFLLQLVVALSPFVGSAQCIVNFAGNGTNTRRTGT